MMELLDVFSDGTDLNEEILKEYIKDRKFIINCDIDHDIIESIIVYILKYNREDAAKGIPPKSRTPIVLYINSSGGDLFVSNHLCDIIDASKTPIYTVAMGLVASAAFDIYICGHKRYAFSNSILLMHDGAIEIQNSTSKARQTMDFLNEMTIRQKELVLKHTNMTEEFYDNHYDQEYYMYADTLGVQNGCVDKILLSIDGII